MIKY